RRRLERDRRRRIRLAWLVARLHGRQRARIAEASKNIVTLVISMHDEEWTDTVAEQKEQEQWLADLLRLAEGDDKKKTEKQVKILEAAVDIFSEKGYAATSTSEIAQKAGVAEGTIFKHYKTKKDLLLSIAGPIVAKVFAPFLMRDFAKI